MHPNSTGYTASWPDPWKERRHGVTCDGSRDTAVFLVVQRFVL